MTPRAIRVFVAVVVLNAACGARSSVLSGAPGDAEADADADSDADADADVDGDGDSDPIACGADVCEETEMCCSVRRCVDARSCCTHGDCPEGLACLPCPDCPGGASCGVGDLGCGIEELEVQPVPPNMMILLDRSGSMAELVDGRRKWDVAVGALDAVLPEYDDRVRFGLAMFPGPEAECTAARIDVEVGDDHADEILDVLGASGPLVTTPIGDSLEGLRDEAGLDDPERKNLVLLVSDGYESCRGSPVVATLHLHDEVPSVSVYVVGFGAQVDDGVLTAIAETGNTTRPGRMPYWTAEDQQGLADALTAIVRSVVPCGFALHELPPVPDRMWVWLNDGIAVPRDRTHGDGWDFEAESNVLTFYGPSCETIRTAEYRVQVVLGCPED